MKLREAKHLVRRINEHSKSQVGTGSGVIHMQDIQYICHPRHLGDPDMISQRGQASVAGRGCHAFSGVHECTTDENQVEIGQFPLLLLCLTSGF